MASTPFTSIARAAMPSLAPLLDNVDRFYSPDTPYETQPSGVTGPGTAASGVRPTGVPGTLYDVFSSAGYTPNAIYGILGNVQQESQFNPGAWNEDEGAGGLFQHRFDRLTNGQAHAQKLGLNWFDTSGRAQALWAVEELNRNPALKAKLNNAQTPEEAATIFDREFEKSAGLHTAQRQKFARAWAGGTPMPFDIPTEVSRHGVDSVLPNAGGYDPAVMQAINAKVAHIQGQEAVPTVAPTRNRQLKGPNVTANSSRSSVRSPQSQDDFDPSLGQSLIARAKARSKGRKDGTRSLPRVQIPGRG